MSFTHFFSIKNIVANFGLFYINDYPFIMLVWNIILAFIPFFLFLILRDYWRKTKFKGIQSKISAGFIFFLWFIFFPNAPYLIGGIRHLIAYCPADSPSSICVSGAWMIMPWFAYSSLGWVFFVILLWQMAGLAKEVFNRAVSRWFIFTTIPLASLGVLFGLTERYNSWDIFTHPLRILQNLLRYMTDWEYFKNWLIFTAGYYILYFFGEQLFNKKIGAGKAGK
jgi:uncharacterized membrane protein